MDVVVVTVNELCDKMTISPAGVVAAMVPVGAAVVGAANTNGVYVVSTVIDITASDATKLLDDEVTDTKKSLANTLADSVEVGSRVNWT